MYMCVCVHVYMLMYTHTCLCIYRVVITFLHSVVVYCLPITSKVCFHPAGLFILNITITFLQLPEKFYNDKIIYFNINCNVIFAHFLDTKILKNHLFQTGGQETDTIN